MSDIAVKAENLGKAYMIGHQSKERYVALRDVVANKAKSLWSRVRNPHYHTHQNLEQFWALKEISFEIMQGERIGIIGRNGAGKSTLLKLLSRITEPTTGRVTIRGRVASLLEVGTGFHPELTGRENIYLNGSILGMTRREIKAKFDDIVEFSGVANFLDTPVKRFSSGMYVRLAFAVAAHLEPDILVVDEVLAVGDFAFQKKCLGKMQEVAEGGRTILFVSHNMPAILTLCPKTILLDAGRHVTTGPSQDVVSSYLQDGTHESAEHVWPDIATAPGSDHARLHAVRALDINGRPMASAKIDEEIVIEVAYWTLVPGTALSISISLFNNEGIHVFASASLTDIIWCQRPHPVGLFRSRCVIPGNFLNDGRYAVTALLVENGNHIIGQAKRIISLDMVDHGQTRGGYWGPWLGVVRPRLEWKTEHCATQLPLD